MDDKPIGYEVILMDLKGTLKSYCRAYGTKATKNAVKQVYAEIFERGRDQFTGQPNGREDDAKCNAGAATKGGRG